MGVLRETYEVNDLEILLYVIGSLSVIALGWSAFDARRRKSREGTQKD